MKPTIGRIVHYVPTSEIARKIHGLGGPSNIPGYRIAAVIVGTHDNDACNLTLFPDVATDLMYLPTVPFSTGNQPGTWNWPERIGEAEVAA